MLQGGAFCNTFDLHLAAIIYVSLSSLYCLFLSGRFTQVLLYSILQFQWMTVRLQEQQIL